MPGLPNTHVIPAGWENRHAPVSVDAMTATCRVTRRTSGTATFDDGPGASVYPTASTVYAGVCRIQQPSTSGGGTVVETGDKPTPVGQHHLSIPLDAPKLRVNDVAEVLTATDPLFVGAKLLVVAAHGGSLVWQRTYRCDIWTATAR